MKLIDTDIAIDHFHGHQAAHDFFAETLAAGESLAISVVTLTELMAGMRPEEEAYTEKLLGLFVLLEVDEATGRKAGEYLREFARSHHLELGDALIAASAALSQARAHHAQYQTLPDERHQNHCPLQRRAFGVNPLAGPEPAIAPSLLAEEGVPCCRRAGYPAGFGYRPGSGSAGGGR